MVDGAIPGLLGSIKKSVSLINHFLPTCFLVMVFGTAIEALTKTECI